MTGALKLATENGRRVGKVPKAKRLAAAPATEAARLRRMIAMIREEAEQAEARGVEAEKILRLLFLAAGKDDPLIVRALARDALVECGHALKLGLLVRYIEMAEEGTLCA